MFAIKSGHQVRSFGELDCRYFRGFTAPILTRTWRGGENGVAAKLVARDFDGRAKMGASVSICFTSATVCQVLTLMTVLVARSRW